MVHARLLKDGVAAKSDFIDPEPARDEDILLVHTPEYVSKLKNGTLSPLEEAQMEVPYSPELIQAFWLAAGGSIKAAELALEPMDRVQHRRGIPSRVSDHGEGFCVIHDVAVAIRRMQEDDKIKRAMTVDCDVHHGNGTAAIFAIEGMHWACRSRRIPILRNQELRPTRAQSALHPILDPRFHHFTASGE